jgi:ribonuclease HII
MPATSDRLFAHDRALDCRYVCGADEVGRAAWAGPLVAAAVRFDYERLTPGSEAIKRLEYLNDSKQVKSERRRAQLMAAICDLADDVAIAVISAAEIDRDDDLDVSNRRALARALEVVAVRESVNLVDWYQITSADGWSAGDPPQRVEGGDRTSAAIAAASIVAKQTRDQLMRGLDVEYPGYGFAAHKGYGGGDGAHKAALEEHGLSPAHRRSSRGCKPYAPRD